MHAVCGVFCATGNQRGCKFAVKCMLTLGGGGSCAHDFAQRRQICLGRRYFRKLF